MLVSVFITNNFHHRRYVVVQFFIRHSRTAKAILISWLAFPCELSAWLREERPLLRKVGGKVHQRDVHQHGWSEKALKRRLL